MFAFLALISAAAYSVQSVLMTSYYRSMSVMLCLGLRGCSLGITMLPLLYLVPRSEYSLIDARFAQLMYLTCACAFVAAWSISAAVRYLPVGIACALSLGLSTMFTPLLGCIFLGEQLGKFEVFCIAVLLISIFGFGFTQKKLPEERFDLVPGALFSLMFGISQACTLALLSLLARNHHPFLIAYIWEFGNGIHGLVFYFIASLAAAQRITPVSWADLKKITLYSAPTVIGTGCYAAALPMGPLGVIAAILSIQIVFNSLLGRIRFNEQLTALQWVLISTIALAVAGLSIKI